MLLNFEAWLRFLTSLRAASTAALATFKVIITTTIPAGMLATISTFPAGEAAMYNVFGIIYSIGLFGGLH
jgi:hypothetical protein